MKANKKIISLEKTKIEQKPSLTFNWLTSFWNTKLVVFKNTLRIILQSKLFIISTPIFITILLLYSLSNSLGTDANNDSINSILISSYAIICMVYLLIFNINFLIRFFIEDKQNGIYDLELRNGNHSGSLFLQKFLATKLISFLFIVLAIIIYYSAFAFARNYELSYISINLFGTGLWLLLVFDTFVSVLILFFSFTNKIKLVSFLTSIFSLIFIMFPILSMFVSLSQTNFMNNINLDLNGQFSLHYAKKINEVRAANKGGIIDKMITGDGQLTDFSNLDGDKWEKTVLVADAFSSLGIEKKYNLNSQLVFNGLIPDSQILLSNLGVLEKTSTGTITSFYKTILNKDGLTAAQNTYFNDFFVSKNNLFDKTGKGYSYEEWQKTIFNVSNKKSFFNGDTIIQQTINPKAAIAYLEQAIQDISKSLKTDLEQKEWKQLIPIIKEAFNSTYIFSFNGSNLSYLQKENIFNSNALKDQEYFSFGANGLDENSWNYPILTNSSALNDSTLKNNELEEFQKQLFKKMTVKPGTRELMSIMASLISNSLIVSNLTNIISSSELNDKEIIHSEQNKIYLNNPFKWIETMLTNSKTNPLFSERLLIQQYSTGFRNTIGLENYYVDVKNTTKLNSKNYYVDLINQEDIQNPNFNWQDIELITASFSPIGAMAGWILVNLLLIGVAYWVFKRTLIK